VPLPPRDLDGSLDPTLPPGRPALGHAPSLAERVVALMEVALCSDYPTQFLVAGLLAAFRIGPTAAGGQLTLRYVVLLSFADTVLLVGLILLLLRAHGEHAARLFFGPAHVGRELVAGLLLVPVALAVAFGVLLAVQQFAPWLHTVQENPLQALIQSPRDAWLFASVVVIAGGVREEVQRAFLLHRFERFLGGPAVGVVVTSVVFGAGHALQGLDAAFATGTLGAVWAVVYLRRRSIIAPMVSHAGFNLLEIVQFLALGK
jgi:CAAX protease family protein